MVDFSTWENLWNTYAPSGKLTPGSPAAICNNLGTIIAVLGFLALIATVIHAYMFRDERSSRLAVVTGVTTIVGASLMLVAVFLPMHTTSTAEPPTLAEQITRTWNLDDLDNCKRTSDTGVPYDNLPKSELWDGDWKCVAYTDGHDRNVTVHIKDHKVGLYTQNGKTLKVEKEKQ